jgi:hypothetical protein
LTVPEIGIAAGRLESGEAEVALMPYRFGIFKRAEGCGIGRKGVLLA